MQTKLIRLVAITLALALTALAGPSWAQNSSPARAGQLSQANIHLVQRDFLIQQNWVNAKRGHCAMSYLK